MLTASFQVLSEPVERYGPGRGPRSGRNNRVEIGRRGEDAAAEHLESLGLRILERRFRTRCGEIDLIADDAGTLVFVEVKTRRGIGYGRPAEAVDRPKMGRILRAAALYLTAFPGPARSCRFDVVEVLEKCPGEPYITHLKDAFQSA